MGINIDVGATGFAALVFAVGALAYFADELLNSASMGVLLMGIGIGIFLLELYTKNK